MIFVTIANLVSPPSFPLPGEVRGRTQPTPSERKDLPALGCYGNSDLVEGRVGNLIGFNLWSSLNDSRQDLCYFWIGSAVVSFRVLCCVPQADSERFCSCRTNERDFVLESLLFSKQGNNFLLDAPGKLPHPICLPIHVT